MIRYRRVPTRPEPSIYNLPFTIYHLPPDCFGVLSTIYYPPSSYLCTGMTFTTHTGTSIEEAAVWLHKGETAGIPTETVYGLAANALDAEAVVKIFSVKNRPTFDPLIVHIKSIEAMDEYGADIPDEARLLANTFWPGPLTLVVKKKHHIPDLVTSGLDTVGLRMPAHPLTLQLLHLLDFPLAAPSANPFGYISPTSAQHVFDQLQGRIPYILDGGPCRVGIESTIVGFENGQCVVYREGGIATEQLEAALGKPVAVQQSNTPHPVSPGMLESHYAPRTPLYVGDVETLAQQFPDTLIGIISLQKQYTLPNSECIRLSPSGNMEEAAMHLFAAMRELDGGHADVILAEHMPDAGLGRAINDRLRRASVKI